jgi:hypothetical protein
MIRLEMTAVARDVTTPPASLDDASAVKVTAAVDTVIDAAVAARGAAASRQAPSGVAEPASMTNRIVLFT